MRLIDDRAQFSSKKRFPDPGRCLAANIRAPGKIAERVVARLVLNQALEHLVRMT